MRRFAWAVAGLLAAGPAWAADDKEDVKNAAKKLGEQANYSYTLNSRNEGGGGGGRMRGPGQTEGKVEKDGYTYVTTKMGEVSLEGVIKGTKAVVKTKDGWKGADEFQGDGGGGQQRDPAAGFARGLKSYKAPTADAEGLVDKVKELKNEGDGVYSGEFSEDGAKAIFNRGGGDRAPKVTEPKGSAKFWIKDGVLVKYEYNLQGKMTMQGREMQVNRTVTVEIKDVGSTTIEVPEEAKKKLES